MFLKIKNNLFSSKKLDFKSIKDYNSDVILNHKERRGTMTNSLELELQIKRIGISKKEIAKRLGITDMTLFNKIRNETEFKASEIAALTEILMLTEKQRNLIFFDEKCDFKS